MTSSSRNAQYAENVGRHTGYSRKSPLSNHSRVIPISFITRTFNLRILFMSNKSRPIMPSVPFGGDDCDRPACDDVKDAMTKSGLQFERTKRQPNFATKDVATTDCPVNTSQLGRSSWTLLHSVVSQCPVILFLLSLPTFRDMFVAILTKTRFSTKRPHGFPIVHQN